MAGALSSSSRMDLRSERLTSASNDNTAPASEKALAKCPICESDAVGKYAPFCSKRCADVDLHRWLTGRYAIPAQEDDSDGVSENDQ